MARQICNRLQICGEYHSLPLFRLYGVGRRRGLIIIDLMRNHQQHSRNAKNNPANKFYNAGKNSRHNSKAES